MLDKMIKLGELEERLVEERIEVRRLENLKELIGMKVQDVEDDLGVKNELGDYRLCIDSMEQRWIKGYKEGHIEDEIVSIIVDFDCGLSTSVKMLISKIESDDEIDWGESKLYDSRGYVSEEIDSRGEIIDEIESLMDEIEDEMSYLENEADEDEIEEIKEKIEDLMDAIDDQEEALDYVINEYPFEDFIS